MPLGTRSHAKAVSEARSFSAPFFSGFRCHFGEAFGSQNRPKSEKKPIRRSDGISTSKKVSGTDFCDPRHALPGIMCMAPGRTFGGGQELTRTWKNRARRQELERNWKKELEDPGRLI